MEIVRKGCIKMTAEFNTKYNFAFSQDVILTTITRLTNQLWKLIPMRENEEDWKNFSIYGICMCYRSIRL